MTGFLSGTVVSIYNEGVHTAYGGRPAFWGDIFGDWREEFIVVANDYSEIRIYSTTIQATNRLYCLMQNPEYRDQYTCKGYYQASYPDYYLGEQMQPPAIPPVSNAKLTRRGNAGTNWDAGSTANWFTNNLWISNNTAVAFNVGDTVLFDISGSNNAINLNGSLQPGAVTVHSPKDFSFNGGSLNGAMQLTKAGAGKLIFNNTNNFTGRTLICESPFLVNGALPHSPVTVRGGVWLDGRLGGNGVVGSPVSCEPGGGISPGQGTNSPGTLTIANSLTLNSALNDFDLSDDPSGTTKTNDLLNVSGTLTLLGTNTLTIHKLNSTLPPGIYPLINYSGALSGGLNNFTVAGLDGTPLALTNLPGQIALVVKSVRPPANLVWKGGQNGNAWDLVTTSNFLNGAVQDFFVPQDSVTFSDAGLANTNINLSGTLTINNDNSYTGRTVIGGGVLEVNDLSVAGARGPLGSAPNTSQTNLVLYGGATLRFTGPQAYTDRGIMLQSGTNTLDVVTYGVLINCSGLVTGGGALQKLGQGTFILGTSNSYSGGTIIKSCVVQLATEAANQYGFGTGTVTLDGGILKMLDDSSTYSTASYNIFVPTNSFGELDCDSRIDLYGSLTGGGTLNDCIPFVRTTLYGDWSSFTGKINVFPGIAGDSRTGGTGTNGDFRISNSYGYGNCAIYLTNWMYAYHTTASTTVAVGELSGAPNSFLTAGAWQVGAKNTDATFAGRITGTSITKVGTGAWTLTGSNNYTGTTTVNAGTLFINGDNHSATAAVTVNASGTLGEKGIVGGATTVNGKFTPGPNFATILFSNNLTLAAASTTLIEISKTPKTNDAFVVSGSLSLNGALTVTNLSGTPALGDSFKLFTAAAPSGNFSSVTLPPLANGLAWNKTALVSSGVITVVSNTPPRITKLNWSGAAFALNGSNGVPGNAYYVVGTTNLALPLTNWTRLVTNVFDAGGNFGWTNVIRAFQQKL
jgi:autotransporter-associated beta strand protein